MRTFKIYSLSNLQICHTAVLTTVIMLYITSPVFIHLELEVCSLWPPSSNSCNTYLQPPTSGNHKSDLFFSEFVFGVLLSFLDSTYEIVTESGVQLLAAQKPIKTQIWWKGKCFILEASNWWGGRIPVQRPTPPMPPTNNQGARAFIGEGRGLHAETARSALTVILKLVIGGLPSVILVVLSTVNIQFGGQFVPTSLRPVLGIVAAYVMATDWSSCS